MRAPCGHRAGTERAPSGHRLGAAKARESNYIAACARPPDMLRVRPPPEPPAPIENCRPDRPDRLTCALGEPMIGKYGPLEISSWFRSGLSQTGAKPSLIFGGASAPHGRGSEVSGVRRPCPITGMTTHMVTKVRHASLENVEVKGAILPSRHGEKVRLSPSRDFIPGVSWGVKWSASGCVGQRFSPPAPPLQC